MIPRLGLALPQALLVALPVGWLLWRYARRSGVPFVLRALTLGALILALAQPFFRLASAGSDVVVVVDRSASMPPGSESRAHELVRLLERERRSGDRLAVVGFGRTAAVEQGPAGEGAFAGFNQSVDADGSDLVEGLERAAALIPADRRGAMLVVSDGRITQGDLRAAALRLAGRGIPVDHRLVERSAPARDVAVISLDVPPEVAEREPFQFSAVVHASEATSVQVRLERDGHTLAAGKRSLVAGDNVLIFRDRLDSSGLGRYRLTVTTPGDGLPENDVGDAVLRVRGPERVLLVSRRGSVLQSALQATGLRVERRAPGRIGLAALEGVSAVVLEDVEAESLGEDGLRAVAQVVTEAGSGLVMTGGRHSFGEGGYRRSPIEEVLPVSLEVRQEQRRSALAMSIVMDCSGSMSMTLPDGRTKMRLAGEGAVAALTLLGPEDEAAVHMVDTEPHTIFDLMPVTADVPLDKVARGFSGGGGILVGVALRSARKTILASDKRTRHVVLFADAADATDPEDYKSVLADLRANDVTVSVIAMGSPTDGDAPLLREVAALGGGRVYFAENAASLPRVFSQETLVVARSSYVEGRVGLRWSADLALLGAMESQPSVTTDGYNLTYAKPEASVGIRSADENGAPLVAFRPVGLGRSAAVTVEVDGPHTGALRTWPGHTALLAKLVRWTLPPRTDIPGGTARAQRVGDLLHVTLDLEEGVAPPIPAPKVAVLREGEKPTAPVPLTWEGEGRMGRWLPLSGRTPHHPVLQVAGQAIRLPPVTLPYSPELLPVRAGEGAERLRMLSRLTGGTERTSVAGLFRNAPASEGAISLMPWLVALSLLTLLAEVVLRRIGRRALVTGMPAATAPRAIRAAREEPPRPDRTGAPQPPTAGTPTASATQPAPEAEPPPDNVEAALAAARKKGRARRK